MSDSNTHSPLDVPYLMVGKGAGVFAGNRHMAAPKGTQLANVMLTRGPAATAPRSTTSASAPAPSRCEGIAGGRAIASLALAPVKRLAILCRRPLGMSSRPRAGLPPLVDAVKRGDREAGARVAARQGRRQRAGGRRHHGAALGRRRADDARAGHAAACRRRRQRQGGQSATAFRPSRWPPPTAA